MHNHTVSYSHHTSATYVNRSVSGVRWYRLQVTLSCRNAVLNKQFLVLVSSAGTTTTRTLELASLRTHVRSTNTTTVKTPELASFHYSWPPAATLDCDVNVWSIFTQNKRKTKKFFHFHFSTLAVTATKVQLCYKWQIMLLKLCYKFCILVYTYFDY